MRHLLALPALLRSAAILASVASAFSVQDDLRAFPQYDVLFEEDWLSEEAAQSKSRSSAGLNVDETERLNDVQASQVSQYQQVLSAAGGSDGDGTIHVEYERMILDGTPWLCRIPKIKKPAEAAAGSNTTLSKAEEEKELARATDRGWELLSGMQGNCVFFISGWWSYRFCYNQDVKQFHQLSPGRGVPVYPPVEDPAVPGFMLGKYSTRPDDEDAPRDSWAGESALDKSEGTKRKQSGLGELVQRGESRYLVQKLGGGTTCDLTGKERKVEVQFHCNPQTTDRISLIKETSTCHYLMVIQTPRLCNDVAFLPPRRDQPNPMTCAPILQEDEVKDYEKDLEKFKASQAEAKKQEAMAEAAAAIAGVPLERDVPVGDIYVGRHRLVPEGQMIEKSAIVGGSKETYVDTVASSDGKTLSKDQLEKYGLSNPKEIEGLKKRLEKIAQGQQWKLDVIDTPQGREFRAIIGDDEEDDTRDETGVKGTRSKENSESSKEAKKKDKKKGSGQRKDKKAAGSEEEYYHEEL